MTQEEAEITVASVKVPYGTWAVNVWRHQLILTVDGIDTAHWLQHQKERRSCKRYESYSQDFTANLPQSAFDSQLNLVATCYEVWEAFNMWRARRDFLFEGQPVAELMEMYTEKRYPITIRPT